MGAVDLVYLDSSSFRWIDIAFQNQDGEDHHRINASCNDHHGCGK